ncbi:MAG: YgaP-like transmembrane domain [Bacteroidales bacterium]
MKKNVGSADKIIRICIALSVSMLIFVGKISGSFAWISGVFSSLLVLSSILSFSGIYAIFQFDTYNIKLKKKLVR